VRVERSNPPGVFKWISRHSAFSFLALLIASLINAAEAGLMDPSIFMDITFCAGIPGANASRKKPYSRICFMRILVEEKNVAVI
jgi:hypothetical protein